MRHSSILIGRINRGAVVLYAKIFGRTGADHNYWQGRSRYPIVESMAHHRVHFSASTPPKLFAELQQMADNFNPSLTSAINVSYYCYSRLLVNVKNQFYYWLRFKMTINKPNIEQSFHPPFSRNSALIPLRASYDFYHNPYISFMI